MEWTTVSKEDQPAFQKLKADVLRHHDVAYTSTAAATGVIAHNARYDDLINPRLLFDFVLNGGYFNATLGIMDYSVGRETEIPTRIYHKVWFPHCCGAHVLNVIILERMVNEFVAAGFSMDVLAGYIKSVIAGKAGTPSSRPGMYMAATSDQQNNRRHNAMLLAFGFSRLFTFTNPKTGATITMWVLYNNTFEVCDGIGKKAKAGN